MSRRLAAITVILGVVLTCAGCSTPKTAPGTLAQGKQEVVRLVLEAAAALPASHFTPPSEEGAQPCRKSFAGFSAGLTGAHRAQVPLIVYTPKGESAASLLVRVESAWRKAGYRVVTTRQHESQYPQLSAYTADGYEVAATAFDNAAQIDLYAVSQCLRGS